MTGKLKHKVALVTGGNSGIGLATARRFCEEGAFVFITGRRQEQLDDALGLLGPNAAAVRADVSDMGQLDCLVEEIRSKKGQLDVLFANAGSGLLAPLGEITQQHFDQIFNVNVRGLLFTVQKALPLMLPGSTIVLNASIASAKGIPAFSVYSASKAAVRNFARSWALDLRGRGIRVNVVSPGVVPTAGYELLGLTQDQIDGLVQMQVHSIPLGRVGTADEVAKAVVFLASDDSSFVNGVELLVDGGMTQV
jgi:NAD(P)-dependent dehydrogenase (short-subunit alcohol dehydrogenase family)